MPFGLTTNDDDEEDDYDVGGNDAGGDTGDDEGDISEKDDGGDEDHCDVGGVGTDDGDDENDNGVSFPGHFVCVMSNIFATHHAMVVEACLHCKPFANQIEKADVFTLIAYLDAIDSADPRW